MKAARLRKHLAATVPNLTFEEQVEPGSGKFEVQFGSKTLHSKLSGDSYCDPGGTEQHRAGCERLVRALQQELSGNNAP